MSERTIESLSYAIRGPVLLKYFGQLCIAAAVLTSVSLMVSLLYGEFAISLRYAIIIALFLGCGIADTTVTKIIRHILPFFIAMIVVLLICTYVPAITMWLPEKLGFVK